MVQKLEPSPIAKNSFFFQIWEKSVGRGQPLASYRPWVHLEPSRPSSTFVGLARHEAGWPWVDSRPITKNGYTRSLWSQKRVHPEIKSKINPTSHAIASKTNRTRYWEMRTRVHMEMVLMLGFQPFLVIFFLNNYSFAYSVHSFPLLLRSFSCSFFVGLFWLFSTFHYESDHYAHLSTYVIVQDLYCIADSTDPTQETCAIDFEVFCRRYGSHPSTWTIEHTEQ